MPRPHDRGCPHKGTPRFERSPVLSSSYRNRLNRPVEEEAPPPPPEPDYIVTGTLNPDATGNYFEDGTHDGKPTYRRTDSAFWIWYHQPAVSWIITTTVGPVDPDGWFHNISIEGTYTPFGAATGIATVTAAP